ncbi:MAG: M64 family metallopeptidase [Melioribacteraceae bacterium]
MKYFSILFTILLIAGSMNAQDLTQFNTFFNDKTMRIDYHHTGDAKTEIVSLDQIYVYGIWAGSRINLIDNFNNGAYYVKIYDNASGKEIYSKGFDSYFKEYQTSEEAANGIIKAYHESGIIPEPKAPIRFTLNKRDRQNNLNEIYSLDIDPANISIIHENITDETVKIYQSHYSGDPHTKVDIVILGEGYTLAQEDKFKTDLEKFTAIIFNQEPYKSQKEKFNIYGVFKPSTESGTDNPPAGEYRKTVLNSTFNSLGSERYLLTEDNKAMRDMAAHVPYDAIYIMVNHKRYGGGGIYNFYCTFTTDNQFHEYLFLHEFGHSFSGLADEYYTSDVAYNEFYPKGVEPVEPNITALLDKDNVKWKALLTPGIEVPTPWEKEGFDKQDYAWQKIRREMNKHTLALKKGNAPAEEIKKAEDDYNAKDKEQSEVVDKYLQSSKYWGKVGVFEGAGYAAKGLYRSQLDCIMFSKGKKPFCEVCEDHILKVIEHYTE